MGKAGPPLSCPPGDILGSSHPSTVWVSQVLDRALPQAHISASSLPQPTLPSSAFSFPPSIASLELFLIVSLSLGLSPDSVSLERVGFFNLGSLACLLIARSWGRKRKSPLWASVVQDWDNNTTDDGNFPRIRKEVGGYRQPIWGKPTMLLISTPGLPTFCMSSANSQVLSNKFSLFISQHAWQALCLVLKDP